MKRHGLVAPLFLTVFSTVFFSGCMGPRVGPKDFDAWTIDSVAGTGRPELGLFHGLADEVNIAQPFGVEFGPDGGLYICEVGNHRVLRLDLATREVTTVAGNGEKGYSGDDGPAIQARLNEPYEVRFDADGDMYFVEMQNHLVRKVAAKTGIISTIAGTGEKGYSGDGGPATKATLSGPHSIALDSDGHLYIADIGNHRIRRVDKMTGIIESIAGNGAREPPTNGAVATGRPMLGPRALHIAGHTLLIALREGHSVWKMDLRDHKLTHVAGSGEKGYRDGPRNDALFNGPKGIVQASDGAIYVVDTENQAIRRVDPIYRSVTTVAGDGPGL